MSHYYVEATGVPGRMQLRISAILALFCRVRGSGARLEQTHCLWALGQEPRREQAQLAL